MQQQQYYVCYNILDMNAFNKITDMLPDRLNEFSTDTRETNM